jgi:thiol:disulfide interchange protein
MRTLDPARTPEYRAAMTLIVGACTLAALGSVLPVVEQATNLGMAGLGVLALLVIVLRLIVRFVRERLEDRADARTAAAWRATHRTASTQWIPAGVT